MSHHHPHSRNGLMCTCAMLRTPKLIFDGSWRLFVDQHWNPAEQKELRLRSTWLDRLAE